jgi:hypothetical protein
MDLFHKLRILSILIVLKCCVNKCLLMIMHSWYWILRLIVRWSTYIYKFQSDLLFFFYKIAFLSNFLIIFINTSLNKYFWLRIPSCFILNIILLLIRFYSSMIWSNFNSIKWLLMQFLILHIFKFCATSWIYTF